MATTLEQAEKILDALVKSGVKVPVLLLRGYYEGGVKHESLANLDLEADAGSKKQLSTLTQKTENAGGKVFLVTNLVKIYGTSDFTKSTQASRRQDDYIAEVTLYAEPILSRERGYTESFYVSPAYLAEYVQKVSANFRNSGFAVSGIAADDIGNLLVGDYRNKANISRIHTTQTVESAISELASGRTLILNTPNDYALKYASAVYDLPDGNNGHKVEDDAVPFLQLVLDGCCVYTSEAWNESAYMGIWRELNFAIESKGCPHFIFSYENEEVFLHTEDIDSESYFMTQYERWLDMISESYARFETYWSLVRDTEIAAHDIVGYGLRRVTFGNGVMTYVNYNSSAKTVDGITIPARDFVITGVDK